MSHLEDYKQAQRQDQRLNQQNQQENQLLEPQQEEHHENVNAFYQTTINRSLPGDDDYQIDYDANQLMEYFEDRNLDKTADDFQMRTKYYFTDEEYAIRKKLQYEKFSTENNALLTAYAQNYTNRKASKRIDNARNATLYFRIMSERMIHYRDDQNAGALERYNHKEEIMSYRLKGMLEAAEMKSKSKTHMKYLKGRARLSCNMILKDQLDHMIAEEQDQRIVRKLRSKLAKVESRIKSAQSEIRDNIQTVQQTWREKNGINSTTIAQKRNAYRADCGIFSNESTKILFNLQTLQQKDQSNEWPFCIVLKDGAAPINLAEAKKKQFNDSYSNARNSGDQNEINRLEMEALHRFEKMKLPTPKQLEGRTGPGTYVLENTRDYYELTKKILPYYLNKCLEDGPIKEYAQQNQKFRKKLYYLKEVDKYITYSLRKENTIRYFNGQFVIENQDKYKFKRTKAHPDWYRENAYGLGREVTAFRNLEEAFRNYSNDAWRVGMPVREEKKRINIVERDNVPKGRLLTGINLKGMPEKDIDYDNLINNNIIDNNLINNNLNDDNINIINTSVNKNNKINLLDDEEEDKKEEEKKEEPKKEEKLVEEPGNVIIEEKENKEDNKVEEIKVEENKEEDKKEEDKKEENRNKINVPEEDDLDLDGPLNINELISERQDQLKKEKEEKEAKTGKKTEIKKNEEQKKEEPLNKINLIQEEEEEEIELNDNDLAKYKRIQTDYPDVDFSKEDYLVYKVITDAHMVSHSQSNEKALKKGEKERVFVGMDQLSLAKLSKAPAPLLKSLRYKIVLEKVSATKTREHERGITPEDEEKRIENRNWISLWTTTEKGLKRIKYVEKNLPKMFDDFQWPTVKELEDGTALKGERLFEIMDMIRREKGLYALSEMSKISMEDKKTGQTEVVRVVYNIMNEPEFAAKLEALQCIENYVTTYLRMKNKIDIKPQSGDEVGIYNSTEFSDEKMQDVAKMQLKTYAESRGKLSKKALSSKEDYLKAKEAERQKKKENPNKINIINEIKEDKKEEKKEEEKEENLNKINIINEIKEDKREEQKEEENPNSINIIVDDDYVKDMIEKSGMINDNPVYQNCFKNNVNPIWHRKINNPSLDRGCIYMLKFVRFDKSGEPVSKEDKENHAWNMKWFGAIEKGKEDTKVIGEMVEEYLPHVYDGLDLPPMPREGSSPNESEIVMYRKQLDAWCDRVIESGKLDEFYYRANIGLSINQVEYAVPGVKEYFQKNPKMKALETIMSNAWSYLREYISIKYPENAPKTDKFAPDKKRLMENKNFMMEVFAGEIMGNYPGYKTKPDEKIEIVPYDKTALKDYQDTLVKEQKFFDEKEEKARKQREERDRKAKNANTSTQQQTQSKVVKKQETTKQETKPVRKLVKMNTNSIIQLVDDAEKTHININGNPEYRELFKDANKYLIRNLSGKTIDRAVMQLFRIVHFNEKNQPISPEDVKNHEWNKKVLKAWQGEKGNIEELGKIVAEYLPGMHDGLVMPPVPPKPADLNKLSKKQKKTEIKAYRKQMDAWCESVLQSDSYDNYNFIFKQSLSTNNLMQKIPGFKDYIKKNPKLNFGDELLSSAGLYLANYLMYKYGYDTEKGQKIKAGRSDIDDAMNDLAEVVYGNSLDYEKHKEDKLPAFDQTRLKEMIPEMEKDKKFWDFKKEYPNVSRTGYTLLNAKGIIINMKTSDPMASAFKMAEKEFAKCDKSGLNSMDRCAMLIMKPVAYDEKGQPLTNNYRKNEAWNMNWFKAWEDQDEKTQEDMLAEFYPHIFDIMEDMPIPDDKQLKNPSLYQQSLNNWIDSVIDRYPDEIIISCVRGLCFDQMKKAFKSLEAYKKADARFDAMDKFMEVFTNYFSHYIACTYKVNMQNTGGEKVFDDNANNIKVGKQTIDLLAPALASLAAEFGKHKKDKPVPFTRMGKTQLQ